MPYNADMAGNGFAWGFRVRAALRDANDFDAILEKLSSRIRAAAARYMPRDIDEAVQCATVAVWLALPKIDTRHNVDREVEQYLVTTAHNAIRSASRQARHHGEHEHAFTDDPNLRTRATTLEAMANSRQPQRQTDGIGLRQAAETLVKQRSELGPQHVAGLALAAGLRWRDVQQLAIWSNNYVGFCASVANAITTQAERA